MRRPRSGPSSADGWVEVFPTGVTIATEVGLPAASPGQCDTARRQPALLVDHGPPPRDDAPAARPFGTVATSIRTGSHDIVRPVLIDPVLACRLAVSGWLFDEPVPHLEFVADDHVASRYLLWNGRLVGHHRRPLPATLHLMASRSMVVTVLELVPSRRMRWGRERFVRDGIEAVEALAGRLERGMLRDAARHG